MRKSKIVFLKVRFTGNIDDLEESQFRWLKLFFEVCQAQIISVKNSTLTIERLGKMDVEERNDEKEKQKGTKVRISD